MFIYLFFFPGLRMAEDIIPDTHSISSQIPRYVFVMQRAEVVLYSFMLCRICRTWYQTTARFVFYSNGPVYTVFLSTNTVRILTTCLSWSIHCTH